MSIVINSNFLKPATQQSQNLVVNSLNTSSLVISGSIATLTGENIATTNYVDNKIQGILGDNVNGLLDTITEIDNALNNDPNFYNSITTVINGKASLSSDNTFAGVNNFTNSIQYNGVDLNNRLTTDEGNITTNTNNITALTTRLTTDEGNITTNTNNISALTTKLTTDETNINTNTTNLSNLTTEFNNFLNSGSVNNFIVTQSLTTQSIKDNGNCKITGSTVLGNGNDTLTVNSTGTYTLPQNFQDGITANTINLNGYDLNTKINTLAIDSAVVHISNNENITGVKTFTNGAKSSQSLVQHDNSTNLATTNYVDTAISNLINGAPSTLNTLNQIATLLQTDTNSISSITNTMVDLSSNQNITGIKNFVNGATSGKTLIQGDNSTNLATTAYVDLGLSTKSSSNNPSFTGILTSQSIIDDGNFHAKKNVYLGSTGSDSLTVNATASFLSGLTSNTINLNGTDLNTRLTNDETNISTNTNNITSLNNKIIDITYTSTNDTTNISGSLDVGGNFNSKSISDNGSSLVISNVVDLKNSIQFNGSDISTVYQPKLNYDTVPTSGSLNIVNSGNIYSYLLSTYQSISNMTSYITSSNLTSILASYPLLASTNYFTGANYFAGASYFNNYTNISGISENLNGLITVSSNTLSFDYTKVRQNTFSIVPSSSTNMSLSITNLPVANTAVTFTYTFIIDVSTYKAFINSFNVNGSSLNTVWGGGLSNVSVNSSATKVIQQITIGYLNSGIPTGFSNIVSLW